MRTIEQLQTKNDGWTPVDQKSSNSVYMPAKPYERFYNWIYDSIYKFFLGQIGNTM